MLPAIKLLSCHGAVGEPVARNSPLTDSTSVSGDDGVRKESFAVKWMKVHSPDDALRSAPLRE